jgi:TonB-linked SusC/RagA family outer membrane protein
MRKILTLLSVMMLCTMVAWAQGSVSGTVRDASNSPLAGVKITTEDNKTKFVYSDASGSFTVVGVPAGSKLIFTSKGFITTTIGQDADLKEIVLRKDPNFKGENADNTVVVTAQGQVRQKASLGYSSANIKATELVQASPTNLQNGLTGKVSGINITTVNSGVFGSTRITLRGIRSLTGNNQPMLILNGVPVSLDFISSINPNDVADLNVLKSAAATAIYGAEGVNGAIVITTKKGTKNKPVISVRHSLQLEQISMLPKFQKEFGSGYDQDPNTGQGTYTANEQQSWGDRFDGSIREVGDAPEDPNIGRLKVPYSYVKNGRRDFWETGTTNQTDVSFSTGDFYISAQNAEVRGTLPGDVNKRRTISLRADKEYNKFKAVFTVNYTNAKYNVASSNADIYYGVTGAPGQYDLKQFKDWRNSFYAKPENFYTVYLSNRGYTPYFVKDNERSFGRTDDVFGNVELSYKIKPWVNVLYRLSGTYAGSNRTATRGAFQRPQHLIDRGAGDDYTASLTEAQTSSTRITSEFLANINKDITKDIGFNATVGYSARATAAKGNSINANLGFSNLLSFVSRVGEPNVIEFGPQRSLLQRTFARVGFDYGKWAFLEATASYDQDSRLVGVNEIPAYKDISFFYPGVNASVLLHKAIPAIQNSKYISYAKLRGAVTKSGNVNLGIYSNETSFRTATFFPFNDIQGNLISTLNIAPSFEPEFVVNTEAGIELGFLDNSINFEANAYTQNNTNQIIDVSSSLATGFASKRLNAADFTNKGLEFELKLTPLVQIRNVNIDLKANYTYQTSVVNSLFGGVNELAIGNNVTGINDNSFALVGSPAYRFKIIDYNRDPQGRVIVDRTTGMPSQKSDPVYFGQTTPSNILGVNLNVSWKSLTFSTVVEHRSGNQMLAQELGVFLDGNGISERSAANGRRAFIFPNSVYDDGTGKYVENTTIYTQTYGREFWNSRAFNEGVQSNYIADAAFWKLREVALTYNLPTKWFGKTGIKNASFALTGRNLLIIVPKSNVWTDPEFSTGTGNAQGNSTAANMPPTRFFGASLSLQF